MKVLESFLSLGMIVYFSFPALSQSTEPVLAVNGYDVVSYFNVHEAIRGSNDHHVVLGGLTYYFSSAKNAKAFKQKPNAYKPRYGGNCAFGMAMQGAKVPSDPKTFKIRDGKLYLFYNDFYKGSPFNTIVPWNAGDESALIVKADANWKNMK